MSLDTADTVLTAWYELSKLRLGTYFESIAVEINPTGQEKEVESDFCETT